MRKPRSTATFIQYDLRPAKQAERRILIELLRLAGDIGLPLSSYRYLGMGGNRFYDFLLVHKYLGLRRMVSLEHDERMYERARYSCPYDFIDVRNETSQAFIANDQFVDPTVTWFDYDGGISAGVIGDIAQLGTKLKVGDLLFVTVCGIPPGALQKQGAQERLAWFQDELGGVSGTVTLNDVETASFPDAVHKVLRSALTNAFAARTDGAFVSMLEVEYADSMPMVTVGGGFLANGQAGSLLQRRKNVLPFLEQGSLYRIGSMNLTDRERRLFDRAASKQSKVSKDRNQLKKLGFDDEDIDAYRDLLRFAPHYVETIV